MAETRHKTHTVTPGFSVRQYSAEHTPAVVALYRKAFGEPPWNLYFEAAHVHREMERFSSMRDSHMCVAVAPSSDIVGMSAAHALELGRFPFLKGVLNGGRTVYGAAMAIKKEHREHGIATLFLRHRKEYYREKGYDFMIGRTKNPAMISIYMGLGYRNTGVSDPIYKDSSYFILDLKRD